MPSLSAENRQISWTDAEKCLILHLDDHDNTSKYEKKNVQSAHEVSASQRACPPVTFCNFVYIVDLSVLKLILFISFSTNASKSLSLITFRSIPG